MPDKGCGNKCILMIFVNNSQELGARRGSAVMYVILPIDPPPKVGGVRNRYEANNQLGISKISVPVDAQ